MKRHSTFLTLFALLILGASLVQALKAAGLSGTVVNWGDPVPIPAGSSNIVKISAGAVVLGIRSDGTVITWGFNGSGAHLVPAGLSNVVAVAAGGDHSLALKSDGTVLGWGNSSYATPPAGLNGVVAIAAGVAHSLALKTDGSVVAWGNNGWNESTVPLGLSNVVAIAANYGKSLALKADGTVVGWGGQYPTPPVGLTGAVAIAAGYAHCLAVKSDGTVVGWGANDTGQRTIPAGLNGVVAVAAGYAHSLALKGNGAVIGWGRNYEGEAAPPPDLTGATSISAGQFYSVALKQNAAPSLSSLADADQWNYYDSGDFGIPEVYYVNPVAGLFESTPNGILVKAHRYRGGGTLISKLAYSLSGKVVEYTWSGNGGTGFMQSLCGAMTQMWPSDPGNLQVSCINASYRNSFAGSWVAISNRVYKTTLNISDASYRSVSIDVQTGVVMEDRVGNFDFTVPLRLWLRTGDTGDYLNANLYLKDFQILTASSVTPISSVQASQRAGTNLCDISYDLAGTGAFQVTVEVSTNGGVSYVALANNLSGSGFGSNVAPGRRRQIVWNAAAAFPNFVSTKMRVRLKASSGGVVSQSASPIFVLDTRSTLRGSIFGQVFGSGMPLPNAKVRVLETPYATNSVAGGGFSISNIPSGVGYLVAVAAPGFASTNIANVQVPAGSRNLGVITLRPLGAHKIVPLIPDLNPSVSKVAEGGVAYRYYQAVSVNGKTPAGVVTLQVRLAGGSDITQTGDVEENWPGREAGVSDGNDGIVRIRVPSGDVGNAGTTRKVEVMDAGQVVQSFDVTVTPFKHEKVWGHSLDASIAGKLGVVRVEPGGKLETEIVHAYRGSVAQTETIERTRTVAGKVGVEASVGSFKLGSVKGGAKAGAGFYWNLNWSGKWRFAPDEYDGVLNMQKAYFAFGDIIFLGPVGSEIYGKLTDYWYGPGLQDLLMVESGGEAHLGGYGDVEAGFSVAKLGNVNVRAGADLDVQAGGYLGYERNYSGGEIQEHTVLFGLETEVQGFLGASAALTKFNQSRLRGLGGGWQLGSNNKGGARIKTDWSSGRVKEASIELENEISLGTKLEIFGWKGVEAPLDGSEKVKLTETYTLAFGNGATFGQVAALGKLWNAALPSSGLAPQLGKDGFAESCTALAGAAEQSGSWTTYERSLRRTYEGEFTFPVGADTLAAALELNFTAQTERGAEMVVERGVAPGGRLFPQEYQPDRSRTLTPTDRVFDKELVWLSRADFPPTSGFSRFSEYVSTANPSLTIGGRFSMFFHDVAGGAQIVGSSLVRQFGGQPPAPLLKAIPKNGLLPDYFPAPGQTNLVYGVSGLLQLTAGTNAFPGTATLVIPYSDEQVAGLNEADLRIYHLPDATNQWQLIGGIVDVLSNSVTAVVSNFGTYAVAPPMPVGNLVLSVASNSLTADGVATSVITVSNLMLNNGQQATQSWLYTVAASGVEIVEADVTTNYSGVQLVSTNGVLRFTVRAPLGGYSAKVAVASVAGDAAGELGLNLVDNAPPLAPAGVTVSASQSRLLVGWQTNAETDLAGYRVYYRAGSAGPPWDGTAAVEGSSSPVAVAGTNVTLRGLAAGTNYFVALAAVDTTGNESAPTVVGPLTLTNMPPQPPTGVAVSFGADGTNFLSWALSEDDGYNDRDVARYDIYQAILPGGVFVKIGEAPAGVGVYGETNVPVAAGSYLRYAVAAVDTNGQASAQVLANRFLSGSNGVDNDGDGMADDWELAHGLNPQDPTDGAGDADHDGVSNLEEFLRGSDPAVFDNLRILSVRLLNGGGVELSVFGEAGKSYALEASTNLVTWSVLRAFACTNVPTVIVDGTAQAQGRRFYRVAPLSAAGPVRVSFKSASAVTTNGVDLRLDAPMGLNYRIEVSTNLLNWSTLGILPGTNAPLYLRDSAATNYTQRFYRAVVE